MKDEAATKKKGEPTAEAVAVVWPVAPEAERLKLLMRAKAPHKAQYKLKGRSAR